MRIRSSRLRASALLIAACRSTHGAPSHLNSTTPTVDLGYVKYFGLSNDTTGVTYFRNIHYAAAPTNDLRWRKPVPIEVRNDFHDRSYYNAALPGPACWQQEMSLDYPMPLSEDCLLLDVTVPASPVADLLPVVFFIHGGGFIGGSAQTPTDSMIHQSGGGIITVAIQYRLGLLGFLAGTAIENDGSLNVGLLDQQLALQWVQKHIQAFGGDPSRVAIWGGSAGGSSVGLHMIANSGYGQPPFAAAIASYPGFLQFLNKTQQESQFRYVLQSALCSSLSCLRTKSGTELEALNSRLLDVTGWGAYPEPATYVFGPVVDGEFLRDLPSNEFGLGHFHDVPLLVDHDSYEGYQFGNDSMTTQIEETTDARRWFPFAGPTFFSRLYHLYPRSHYNSTFWQRQSWFGDYLINCPTYMMATSAVDRNTNSSAVFKLVFNAGTQLHGAVSDFLTSPDSGWTSANNQSLARIVTSYYTSFIRTHDPNHFRDSEAPFWPSYATGGTGTIDDGESIGFAVMNITYTSINVVRDADAGPTCDFWSSQRYVAQN